MKISKLTAALIITLIFSSCGKNDNSSQVNSEAQSSNLIEEEVLEDSEVDSAFSGVLGTTCTVKPVLKDEEGYNVCITPDSTTPGKPKGTFFFPGILMLAAEQATIKFCEQANALDYGNAASPPGSCAAECAKVVQCLILTNE